MSFSAWNFIESQFHLYLENTENELEIFLESIQIPEEQDSTYIKSEIKELITSYFESEEFLKQNLNSDFFQAPYQIGEKVFDFEILSYIERGGNSHIYLGLDAKLGREVALKVSHDFGQEEFMMAPLIHENIVRVYSIYRDLKKELKIISMQLIEGGTLSSVFEKGKVKTTAQFLMFISQILNALIYAHNKKVYHLDIKPSNILIGNDFKAYLSDFNTATSARNAIFHGGTFKYMSPEQQQFAQGLGCSIDHRSDLYSLGLVIKKYVDKFLLDEQSPKTIFLNKFIKTLTSTAKEERFSSAQQTQNYLDDYFKMSRVVDKFFLRFKIKCLNNYLCILFLTVFIPNFLGSIINIFYNYVNVVKYLGEDEEKYFNNQVLTFNGTIYPVLILLLCLFTAQGFKNWKNDLKQDQFSGDKKGQYQQFLLWKLPMMILCLSFLGWISSGVYFPAVLNNKFPHLSSSLLFEKFMLSHFISFSFAGVFSLLIYSHLAIGHYFPLTLALGPYDDKGQLASLKKFKTLLSFGHYYIVGMIALLALLLFLPFHQLNVERFNWQHYLNLVGILIWVALGTLLVSERSYQSYRDKFLWLQQSKEGGNHSALTSSFMPPASCKVHGPVAPSSRPKI